MQSNQTALKLMRHFGFALLFSFLLYSIEALADFSEPVPVDESSPSGVSVPISSEASELFAKAGQKESDKQWNEADESYQQILNQFDSKVIATGRDPQTHTYHYQGVGLAVQQNISKWPADGLEIYNANHARALSTGTQDAAEIFYKYFPTNSGKEAGIRLLDQEMENGDFYTAQWTGNRLLSFHPSLGNDRPMILYRTAMACHWAGDQLTANVLSDQLRKLAPEMTGAIGGKTVVLSTELSNAIQIPASLSPRLSTTSESYSSFASADSYGSPTTSSQKIGLLISCIALEPPDYTSLSPRQISLYQNLDESELANDLFTQIMPVSQRGDIFFQDGRTLYAVAGDTGKPLPAWLATYPDQQTGRYRVPAFGRVRNQQLTLTVTPEVVLAVMGQRDIYIPNKGRINPADLLRQSAAKLVCLDRASGAQRWTKSTAELPQSVESLRAGEFSGTPVVFHGLADNRGGSVLVAIHNSKPNGFDECHIVSLSLASGEYQWSTYVGGAAHEASEAGELRLDKASQMTVFQGRVLVMTNRGSLAAIDAESGRILWLYAYQPQDKPANHHDRYIHKYGEQYDRLDYGASAWTYNPIFISQGKIFALPADANSLFILNLNTGFGQKVSMRQFNNAAVCLGVQDLSICFATSYDVFFADWKKLYENAPGGAVLWNEANFTGKESNPICGRGFCSGGALYIPTRQRLYEFSLAAQRISCVYPSQGSLSGQDGPGNLLVTPRNIIVAQPQLVSLYSCPTASN